MSKRALNIDRDVSSNESTVDTAECVETEDKSEETQNRPKPPFLGFGMFCAVVVALLYSVQALTIKLITSMAAIQISAMRCGFQLLLLLPYATCTSWKDKPSIAGPPGSMRMLLLFAFCSSTTAVFGHQALTRLSTGDAETIMFLNIVFTMLFGCLCLGEALTIVDGFLGVSTLVGVVLLSKPPFLTGKTEMDKEAFIGLLFSIARAILLSVCYILIRYLPKVTAVDGVLYYSFVGVILDFLLTFALNSFSYPCLMDVLWISVMASTGIFAQGAIVVGLKYERAATFAVVRSFQIVIVFLLQVLVLNDIPDMLSIVGASLVFTAVFVIGIRKVYNQKMQDRKIKLNQ